MESKRVMVSFNELNKIVTLASDATVKMLKEECVSLFKFGANIQLDIVFQKYDPDWDALIDMGDDDLLIHKDKLKMVVQPLLHDGSSVSEVNNDTDVPLVSGVNYMHGTSSVSSEPSIPSTKTILNDEGALNLSCNRKRSHHTLDSDDDSCSVVSESSYSGASEQKRTKLDLPGAVVKKENEKPLPVPYVFPANYRPEVELCLRTKKMTKEARKHFLSAIASSMFSYKRNPTSEEFIRIGLEIINKYPFMKSTTGSPSGTIVEHLRNRFKEFRRTRTVRKPTSSKSATSNPKTRELKPNASLLKPPEVPAGEDDISFQRHNNQIKAELSKKGRRNQSIINSLVKQTFSMRRKDITDNPSHSHEVLRKYPFLKEVDQLLLEMELICSKEQLRITVRNSWSGQWSLKIFEQAKLEKNSNARLRGAMTDLHVESEQCNPVIHSLCLLPYLIPDRTKPSHEKLICFCPESCSPVDLIKDRKQNEPYLIIFGAQQTPQQVFLVVDQEILCEIDVNDCVFAITSVFFVFDICYTKGLTNVFTFIEHILLNINHSKLSSSVSDFISCLQLQVT